MPPITAKKIATDLGVTTAAVSIALNPPRGGTSKVSAATAERIRAHAAKLNYRPSLASRAMRFRQLQQVGFLIASDFKVRRIEPTVEMPAIFGVNDFLDPKGWHLNIINDAGIRGEDHRLPRYLQEKGLDGVIVGSRSWRRDEVLDHDLKRFAIPAIFLNATREYNCIGLDDHLGGTLATRHLIDYGHRNIVFVGHNVSHSSLSERKAGYEQAMEEKGLTSFSFIDELTEDERDYSTRIADYRHWGERFVEEVYRGRGATAVFCYDDGMALILMRAFHRAGISVPNDISIVGFNDMPFAGVMPPPLTTIRSDFYTMGQMAGELLFKLMENPAQQLPSVALKPELVVRETTKRLE